MRIASFFDLVIEKLLLLLCKLELSKYENGFEMQTP